MSENDSARAAAQLAAVTANIAKGAAEGGAYGAAVGAVKGFLPQIVKVVAGLLFFLLCLPLIIFVALPSCLFGFPSVMDEEIQDMTVQAQTAYGNYAQTQQSIQNHADAVLQQASEGFDDVAATKDLQGFDAYWMAAISSVLHMQELDAINESEIRNITRHAVRQTSSVETYYEEEEYLYTYPDGTTEIRTREVERRRLHISLRAASPDEVMSSLGFTEEQHQWAAYIHDKTTEQVSNTEAETAAEAEQTGSGLPNNEAMENAFAEQFSISEDAETDVTALADTSETAPQERSESFNSSDKDRLEESTYRDTEVPDGLLASDTDAPTVDFTEEEQWAVSAPGDLAESLVPPPADFVLLNEELATGRQDCLSLEQIGAAGAGVEQVSEFGHLTAVFV